MAFDGLVTKAIVIELQKTIIGARVNKIFEPSKNEVILNLYNQGKNYSLLLSANPEFCRICLTNFPKSNPQNALNFCMLLRKYLTGGKVIGVQTDDLERTIEIKFECFNEFNDLIVRKLFVEIMSRQSNIILATGENTIIDALRKVSASRTILPANPYIPPTSNKRSFLKIEYFQDFNEYISYKISSGDTSLTKILTSKFIGFSKSFVSETLDSLHISDTVFNEDDMRKLYNYLKSLVAGIFSCEVFCKRISEKDYTLALNQRDSRGTRSDTPVNTFIDEFYYDKEEQAMFVNSRNSLLKIVSSSLKKVYKKVEHINSKLKECEKKETYRLYGELLTANLYKLNQTQNLDSIELENYYDNNTLIKIPLDKSLSVQKNIEKYFKKYNKLKNALDIVSEQKKDAEKELGYIESIVFSLSNAKTLHDINGIYEEIVINLQMKKNNKPNKKSSDDVSINHLVLDNFTIYVGKNNIQNDYISTKLAKANDIWFHTQEIHGSHVLLKNPNTLDIDDIPEEILFKCASLAKENSKGSESINVPVDYCYAKYVKKPSGSKPGMVTYNNFKTIIVK